MPDHGFSKTAPPNPLTVEVTRGRHVESRHTGAVAIVDVAAKVQLAFGDIRQAVYPRSAIKALQAIAAVEAGAADAVDMSASEIAVMCASHAGEPRHVETVTAMLTRLGLSESDLECGPHWPNHEDSARDLARAGQGPDQRHNNCSGKHAGMLALAKALGVPTHGYSDPTHPVQQRILGVIEMMTGHDCTDAPVARDGCSVPTWAIPLENLAYGFARFGAPDGLPEARQDACRRIRQAVFSDPFMVAGTGRYCTEVIAALAPRVFLKTGAEGVFCACVPEMGIGIALKCDDGATRGAEVMMTAVLDKIGVLTPADREQLAERLVVPVMNRRGFHVGDIRPSETFLSF